MRKPHNHAVVWDVNDAKTRVVPPTVTHGIPHTAPNVFAELTAPPRAAEAFERITGHP